MAPAGPPPAPIKAPRQWPPPLFVPVMAKQPPQATICFHAQLMHLNRAKQQNPGDDAPIMRAAAGIQPGLTKMTAMEKTASRAMVLSDPNLKQIVVAFRGSLPPEHSLDDWITNFAGTPLPVALRKKGASENTSAIFHGGFYSAAREYLPLLRDVRALFAEAKRLGKPRPKLAVTGHSLGGAIASIFAYFLSEDGMIPDEVALFGAPGVDLGSYEDVYHSYISWSSSRHYIVDGDPVTLLPPLAAKPPARVFTLTPPPFDASNATPLEIANERFHRHHLDVYCDKMDQECRESTDQMPRDFFDCFVQHNGRPPTVKELEEWTRTLYVDKPQKTCELAVAAEKYAYKNVKDLFRWKLDRAPTPDELKQYAAIIADTPRKSDGLSNALKTLESSPAYYEWWIGAMYQSMHQRPPTPTEKEFWLDRIAELGLEKARKLFVESRGAIG